MKKFFARLSPLERRFVVGVLAVVFIVLNLVFVRPHLNDWAMVKSRLGDAHRLQAKFDTEIARRPNYESGIRALEKDGATIPQENQDIDFLLNVQRQAAVNHVLLLSTTHQQNVRTNQFFVERVLVITTQSNEKDLVDFLYTLGSASSMIRVRDFSVRPTVNHQQLSASIKLVASYQKKAPVRPNAPGTPAKPAATSPTLQTNKTSTVKRP